MFSYDARFPSACLDNMPAPERYSRCDPPRFVVNGRELPAQNTGCALVGSPYVELDLDPNLKDGSAVRISLSPDSPHLTLYSYGYDSEWFQVVYEVGKLGPAETIILDVSQKVRGLLVATARTGCPPEAQTDFPKFSLLVQF